jgi:glycerophosphoryl diester phosphodiesterase
VTSAHFARIDTVVAEVFFAQQAVLLDGAEKPSDLPSLAQLQAFKAQGIRIVAPPIFALLDVKDGRMTASTHAKNIQQAGLKTIAWSLERSGVMATDRGGWYYQTVNALVKSEGDIYQALDVLVKEAGVIGMFSDWPATTTYYANCMDLR